MSKLNWSMFFKQRWEISRPKYVLLLSVVITFLFNGALLSFLAAELDLFSTSGISIALSVMVIIFLANLIIISSLAILIPIVIKPLFIITSVASSVALYYLITYNVILDKTMMGNILNTRSSESLELLSPTLFVYIFLLSVIPSICILAVKVKPYARFKVMLNLLIIFVFGAIFIYLNASSWLWIDKQAKLIGGKILPWAYIVNTARYYSQLSEKSKKQTLLPLGKFSDNKKIVVVLIIGETARSNNFSLYGYAKNTNPLLQSEDILVFNKTNSCSTYTTASVACMLSHDITKSNYEPLPSYLTRIGAKVVWRTNNWGEPPIKVTKYQERPELKEKCHGEACKFDELLLTEIDTEITQSDKQKVFIVLHTKGSHGPSYYSRYPSQFDVFKPVCRHEELSKCTKDELINAYDNTILYTDYFLHKSIQQLKKLNIPSMLIYISDHGESLGEKGLYLHGTPFMVAPKYQKEIPFIIWRSKELIHAQGKSNSEINQIGKFSHLNIFHTIIGAFGVETDVYDKNLDVLNQ